MDPNRVKRNDMLAEQIIKGLESRNMAGFYAHDKEEALKIALSLIPEGSKVTRGGAMSAEEIGLIDALKKGNYDYREANEFKDQQESKLFACTADVFVGGSNAITEDGVLVNIDGRANRVAAYAYGPEKVVLIVGMNKVRRDVDAAMKRARNEAATVNAQRFGLDTPCTRTGKCMDCKSADTICCQFLITRYSRVKDRINVILVNDNLGF